MDNNRTSNDYNYQDTEDSLNGLVAKENCGAGFSILSRIKPEYRYAAIITFMIGLLIHAFKFLNYLPNHDSMYNFYSNQNVLASGRWLLSIACGFSSYFDLPWINGIISIFWISISTAFIVSLFEIRNKITIFVLGALFVSFPSVTEIFFFEFTADGYMLSLLLSVIGVYVLRFGNKSIKYYLISVLCMCMSCGIYQAYLSVSLALGIAYIVFCLLKKDSIKLKSFWLWLLKFALCSVCALIMYYTIWKICMAVQGVTPTSYQGINAVGLSGIDNVFFGIKNSIQSLFLFFFEWNIFERGISLYGLLNIFILLSLLFTILLSIHKSRLYKNKGKLLLLILCIAVTPFIVTVWSFASPNVDYAGRMLHSVVIIFALPIILSEFFITRKIANTIVCVLLIVVFNFAVSANIAYYYLGMEYENTYSEAIEIRNEIEVAKQRYGEDEKVMIVGNRTDRVALDENGPAGRIHLFSSQIEKSLFLDSTHVTEFMKNVLYYDTEFTRDKDLLNNVMNNDKFRDMPCWPKTGSIDEVENTIVVKLSDKE